MFFSNGNIGPREDFVTDYELMHTSLLTLEGTVYTSQIYVSRIFKTNFFQREVDLPKEEISV